MEEVPPWATQIFCSGVDLHLLSLTVTMLVWGGKGLDRWRTGREVVQHALSFPMERHGIYILQALVPSRCIQYTPTYLSQDVIGCTQLYLYCMCSHSLRWKPGSVL